MVSLVFSIINKYVYDFLGHLPQCSVLSNMGKFSVSYEHSEHVSKNIMFHRSQLAVTVSHCVQGKAQNKLI